MTIALAIETKELTDEVQACVQNLPVRLVIEHQDVGDLASFFERLERIRADVVLLDIAKLTVPLEEAIHTVKGIVADAMIIALNTTADAETILASLRAGVHEYVCPPLQDSLRKALERRSAESRKRDSMKQGGKTIGFLSAKGGCGATTIACHMAVELGRNEKHVLLADLDMDAGMVGFLMKTKSPYSLLDAVNNLHRLDTSYWKALTSNGIPGVEIIPAPLGQAWKQPSKPDQLRHVLSFVRSQYDFTLIDLGRGLSRLAAGCLDEVDETFLITTLEVPSLHQAKQIVQSLLDSGYGKTRLRLVLNRVPKRLDVTPGELEKMLGLPIYFMIPTDYLALYECYSEGKLLPRTNVVARQLTRLAMKLTGAQEQKKSKFSFFG